MKRFLYLGGFTVVVGLILLHNQPKAIEENRQARSALQFSATQQVEQSQPESTVKPGKKVATYQTKTEMNASDTHSPRGLVEQLGNSSGRSLIVAIKLFWQTCQTNYDCIQQLEGLKSHLSSERWALLANYFETNQTWQQQLSNLVFNQHQSLSSRVLELKRKANEVWGNSANILFADEFVLYDFSLQAEKLRDVSAQNYLPMFNHLMQTWKNEEHILGLNTPQAKYEKAISLISSQVSPNERKSLIQSLQNRYLNKTQISQIKQRQQQVFEQQKEIDEYQSRLEEFKHQLEQEYRAQPYSEKQNWEVYYQQRIEDFRRRFFEI
ncbi:hypothetical protein [Vibrio azureus]|uniref:Chromosome segregation ATPase n=1 Tax=Vibrio azureus NBRC 104587 TaxID=1219077 RepID=U3APQ1_9VIBR|nr:hypothetical protein [Vibrio azureus]GAD75750.1 hypothetical protein VAZ01S_029_00200 [Vibrio azureus NBRC 104587]